ncbi:MAG: cation:proton antiporter, partial [Clostridia bacterium]|nr:cation:proton antiporter [Clostridia bacterium]
MNFSLNVLFVLAVMIFAGMAFGRLAKLLRLPNVTGYLVAGLLLGPSVTGFINAETLSSINIISEMALGFIAFSIGNEFKVSYFKRVGTAPVVIATFESLFAILFVLAPLLIFGIAEPAFAIVLSSIAAATAPAATIMVINQYRAKGPVTDMLLSVVAIDDATALAMFSVSVAIAQAIKDPAQISLQTSLFEPLWEIFGGLVVGFLLG